MAINVVLNGVTYSIPESGGTAWGQGLTDYLVAQASGLLQKAGGTFTLTAEVDFGATYGLKSLYYKSRGTNPASSGQVRLANAESVSWRNAANDANLALSVDSSNNLTFNGVVISSSSGVVPPTSGGTGISSYTTGDTLYASATNVLSKLSIGTTAQVLRVTGGLPVWGLIVNDSVDAAAAIVYSKLDLTGGIVNADVNASAAIAFSKLAALTSASILVGNGSNVPTAVAVSGDISLSNAGVTAYVGTVPLNKGGTGQTTKSAAFDALSPMSASGDLIYGGASGTGTRLAKGSDGQVLTLSSGLPAWQNPGAATAPLVTTYTSGSGTHTLTGSPLYIRVRMVGGGGGGGGSGTGAGTAATAGGNTTFGTTLLVANGGGAGGWDGNGGDGGTASLGTGPSGIAIQGARGQGSCSNSSGATGSFSGGNGGSSPLGGAGPGGRYGQAGNAAKTNSGSGGGGGGIGTTSNTVTGAGGAAGGYVDAIITSPSASYAYAVGAAGSAGGAGASGVAGGAGGAGLIEVTEYYQ